MNVAFPNVLGRWYTLSFFSLVFLFPWCFSCSELPWSFGVFSANFPGFLRVREVREIIGVLSFPWYFRKDQGKEGQGSDIVIPASLC